MARVGEGVRWCSSCAHEVHDLSALDEDQARALLEIHRGQRLCVRYAADSKGRLRFASTTLTADRLTRRPRVGRFALAAAVSLVLMAGCARPSTPTTNVPSEPSATDDPWAVTLDLTAEPTFETEGSSIIVGIVETEERYMDPWVLEFEDAIIPESITRPRRD